MSSSNTNQEALKTSSSNRKSILRRAGVSGVQATNVSHEADGVMDSNAQGTMSKDGSINQESTLLADAPILKSILKKAVRTVPGKNKNNSKSNVNFVVSNDSNVVPTYDSNVRIVEGLPTEQQKEGVAGHGRSDGVGKAAPSTQVAHNSQGSPNSTLNQPLNKTVDSGNINDEGKSSSEELCMRVFKGWDWTSNGNFCSSGSRIILGWNVDMVDLNVVAMSDQLVCNRPWCVLGDFNSALKLEDKIEGSSVIDIAMREFKECVDANELVDINRSGLQFTWTQKPRGFDGTLRKIDRIMANLGFLDSFAGAHVIFQPYRISDHSPAILHIPTTSCP
ncbi:RNA-directed DNA polymerase, eukaryota, Reverse transcriptase zinc-binding domain protein [Artemisia annua]|uniref:RNA-directed DNA polymerase, eukaryota, Reverse transcriptase zinc-binding domain protein n=1 Tax=Artemisia annua TaxID=35608 RepID=A0A2U1KDT8_ARTAN|nr:RNA-directed DNA polymerase, eukaryota, Reverse transcriptase zinc-binding domain protein [Artemisia annua]